jgi:hypothetical protein
MNHFWYFKKIQVLAGFILKNQQVNQTQNKEWLKWLPRGKGLLQRAHSCFWYGNSSSKKIMPNIKTTLKPASPLTVLHCSFVLLANFFCAPCF